MEQCPICYTPLQIKTVSPCDDCGEINSSEKEDFYAIYEIQGLRLTLCGFCAVDFGSYKPEYFGLTEKKSPGLQDLHFIKDVPFQSRTAKYCAECEKSLKFLAFVRKIREG